LNLLLDAATWNLAQNVKFLYSVQCTTAEYPTYADASTGLGSTGGVALTLSDVSGQYPEQIPAMIAASTAYNTAVNAVQNYMFQMFAGITPGVTSTTVSHNLNTARVNYYGQTQKAGQYVAFYQRGYMLGLSTDPLDMNTYVNEVWLKDAAITAMGNLLLTLPEVPANAQGRSQVLATLQSVVNQALNNGVISVGKTLTQTQIAYITVQTGDANAWQQVQTSGYWMDCAIVPVGSPPDYQAQYLLIYSKDDIVRKIVGQHDLI
jgi:methyl coenzyme M reductase beta subunit